MKSYAQVETTRANYWYTHTTTVYEIAKQRKLSYMLIAVLAAQTDTMIWKTMPKILLRVTTDFQCMAMADLDTQAANETMIPNSLTVDILSGENTLQVDGIFDN